MSNDSKHSVSVRCVWSLRYLHLSGEDVNAFEQEQKMPCVDLSLFIISYATLHSAMGFFP